MDEQSLNSIAKLLVAPEKGILAADESTGTIGKRFAGIGVENTEENRRAYRELLLRTPEIEKYISGVIFFDETIRQSTKDDIPFTKLLLEKGIIPGIKVDKGLKNLEGSSEEKITDGLDGLAERAKEYYALGARFAKWRAAIKIGENIPTDNCIEKNAEILARYAKICQENNLVPIVEPEVLMDGNHSIGRCFEVTKKTLATTFSALEREKVDLSGILLKPNMVIYSLQGGRVAPERVAEMTLECFRQVVMALVPGIVFLSGGQTEAEACENLNAINLASKNEAWELSFSYGRALQNTALKTWAGNSMNTKSTQDVFLHRAKLVSAARCGKYAKEM
ncbi:fructose-bisphosphate aldolase class I, partial [Patescibacteria group bacterium]|nr:fructose-bisphosphate aldolase class I [Patescibacteria group bacterium]